MTKFGFFKHGMSVLYLIAFSSLYVQYQGLYGMDGLIPVQNQWQEITTRYQDNSWSKKMQETPNWAWLYSYSSLQNIMSLDLYMEGICCMGIFLSSYLILSPNHYMGQWMFLVSFYVSLLGLGKTFMSFQWDSLLVEVGFLVILSSKPWRGEWPVPNSVVWCTRFLCFKLMFMAGVVKIQSHCPTWWKLTALQYHYATQCLPTPLAWYAHQLPVRF